MRKGISLVALIITIIVLIILTAAVVLTGGDSPEAAKKAVFLSDASTIQEAVLLYNVTYMANNEGAIPTMQAASPAKTVTLDGIDYKSFDAQYTTTALNLPGITIANWLISDNGAVIYANALSQTSNASEFLFGNGRTVSTSAAASTAGASVMPLTGYQK